MPPVFEPPEQVSDSDPGDRDAVAPQPVWLRVWRFLGIAAASLVVLYLAFLVLLYLMLRDPAVHEGVDSESVEGEIGPGQTLVARVDVSVDMNEIFDSFDRLKMELILADPSDQAAVLGWFGVEDVGETRPALVGERVSVETLDVPFPCAADTERCLIPVEIQLGNVGTTAQRWVLRAVITRDTVLDEEQADSFEVPSLTAQLAAFELKEDEWVSPGPISFDAFGELVGYSITLDTSVKDPSLFEVLVTEPRQWLVTRSIHAVIGPRDLAWSLVYFDPSPRPLAQQARCDENGCQLNIVALFKPSRDDWWIPIVHPTAHAPSNLLKQHSTQINIEPINVTETTASLGERNPSDSLTIHLEAEPNTTEAALAVRVYPEDNPQWAIPQVRTDENQPLQMYRWFQMDCSPHRCKRDLEVTWDLSNQTEPIPLETWITVIGGTGNGLASQQPPSISIEP